MYLFAILKAVKIAISSDGLYVAGSSWSEHKNKQE